MDLRPYQHRAIAAIRSAFAQHRAVCLALQVGGGKTVIACEIIRRALALDRRVLFVVHRVELVEQARDRLAAFGLEAGIIKAGFPERRELPVQVACVPTLIRRKFPPADLVILDECHHAVSDSWLSVLNHYGDAWRLGITATPQRLDGKPLAEAFAAIVEPVTTRALVDDGYLVEPTVFAPPSIDRRGLRMSGGDYSLPQIAERMAKLTGSITDYWQRHCRGRRTLCFAVNVDHSERIRDALADAGAIAVHIDGNTPRERRAEVNAALRAGQIEVVTQCMIWTEGLDIPELECLIVARPTASLGLHRQMIGRVMRPAPNKAGALVLDHAGNHHVHGEITQEIEWSLDGKPKKIGEAPVRTCGECFAIIPLNARQCPNCGAIPEADEAEPPGVENDGVLVKFNAADKRIEYRRFLEMASEAGYALGWARFRFKERFGTWPRFRADERELYRCGGHRWEAKDFGGRRLVRCARCYDEQVAARV